jgi:hypothetical protein
MKTIFDTKEDKQFLNKLYWHIIMESEPWILTPKADLAPDYCNFMKEMREKCFECLEEIDPHKQLIDRVCAERDRLRAIEKEIKEHKERENKSKLIILQ